MRVKCEMIEEHDPKLAELMRKRDEAILAIDAYVLQKSEKS